jgi:hypothetical protein
MPNKEIEQGKDNCRTQTSNVEATDNDINMTISIQ